MIISKYTLQPQSLRLQIVLFFQFTYIYVAFKRWYNGLYDRFVVETRHRTLAHSVYRRFTNQNEQRPLGFPKPYQAVTIYKLLSTSYLVYVFIRSFLPLESFIASLNPRLPPHCYVMGRYMLWGPMSNQFAGLISLYHLLWRFYTSHVERECKTSWAAFLFLDDELVERNSQRDGERCKQPGMSAIDRYTSSIMYYRASGPKSADVFRLRPNRSREARFELSYATAEFSASFLVFAAVGWIAFAPFIIYYCISDIQYVKDYPRCYPLLDDLYSKQQLHWYSVTIKNHKFIANLFDLCDNVFLWSDNLLAGSLMAGLPFLQINDLMIYWRHLHENAKKTLMKVRMRHQQLQLIAKYTDGNGSPDLFGQERDAYDRESHGIQEMMYDFFRKITDANEHYSMANLMLILIWLSYFSCAAYQQLIHPDEVLKITNTRALTLGIFVCLALQSSYMFTFRRNVLKTYPIICSLMAFDVSSYRLKYIGILNYYTEKNRAGFTVAYHPYTPTAAATIVGYTISCIFLIQNFTRG